LPSELPPGAVPTSQNLLLLFTSRIVSVTTLRVPMLRPKFHIIGVLAVASAPSSPAQSVPNPLSSTTADESDSLRGDKRRRNIEDEGQYTHSWNFSHQYSDSNSTLMTSHEEWFSSSSSNVCGKTGSIFMADGA
jgi:hypothetical protein